MAKQNANCWEYFKCGCEPGGKSNSRIGICPAASEERYDGINNGTNGGRFCWLVEDTLCNEVAYESFLDKFTQCLDCEFYSMLQSETK